MPFERFRADPSRIDSMGTQLYSSTATVHVRIDTFYHSALQCCHSLHQSRHWRCRSAVKRSAKCEQHKKTKVQMQRKRVRTLFSFKPLIFDFTCYVKTISQRHFPEALVLNSVVLLYVLIPSSFHTWYARITFVAVESKKKGYFVIIQTDISICNISTFVKIAEMIILLMYLNSRHFVMLNNKN